MRTLGPLLHVELDKFLDEHPEIQEACLRSLGSNDTKSHPTEEQVRLARSAMNVVFQIPSEQLQSLQVDFNKDFWTPLIPALIENWGKGASGPAIVLGSWLREGAPGRINSIPPVDGIFPTCDGSAEEYDEDSF